MPRSKRTTTDIAEYLTFRCPGCNREHTVSVSGPYAWAFDGDLDLPTVRPSILVNGCLSNPTVPRCHFFVTRGQIMFLWDCTHKLAGKTVDLPDLPADEAF